MRGSEGSTSRDWGCGLSSRMRRTARGGVGNHPRYASSRHETPLPQGAPALRLPGEAYRWSRRGRALVHPPRGDGLSAIGSCCRFALYPYVCHAADSFRRRAPWYSYPCCVPIVIVTDEVFLKLKGLLEPFGITKYYTDYWGAYTRHLDADAHQPGKRNTQQIERKHLTLRTRIKRLMRKTICFSRSTQMHDIVIGLFVNRYEFGMPV